MDLIKAAREIGHGIQEEESYKNYKALQEACDKDEELQNLIGELNLQRIAINNETMKEDKDEEKLKQMNKDIQHVYAQIMSNENMSKLQNSQMELNQVVQRVLAIITNSANGEDPDTTDLSNCTHDCSTCGGCH